MPSGNSIPVRLCVFPSLPLSLPLFRLVILQSLYFCFEFLSLTAYFVCDKSSSTVTEHHLSFPYMLYFKCRPSETKEYSGLASPEPKHIWKKSLVIKKSDKKVKTKHEKQVREWRHNIAWVKQKSAKTKHHNMMKKKGKEKSCLKYETGKIQTWTTFLIHCPFAREEVFSLRGESFLLQNTGNFAFFWWFSLRLGAWKKKKMCEILTSLPLCWFIFFPLYSRFSFSSFKHTKNNKNISNSAIFSKKLFNSQRDILLGSFHKNRIRRES